MGLVNKVVPTKELSATCETVAKEIIGNDLLALDYVIGAINRGLDLTLKEGLQLEAGFFGKACSTGDNLERTKAFFKKKRKANFQGK